MTKNSFLGEVKFYCRYLKRSLIDLWLLLLTKSMTRCPNLRLPLLFSLRPIEIKPGLLDSWVNVTIFILISNLVWMIQKSSRLELFCKKGFLKNSQSSHEKTRAGVFFKQSCRRKDFNFIAKGFQHRCFPVNFPKFSQTAF